MKINQAVEMISIAINYINKDPFGYCIFFNMTNNLQPDLFLKERFLRFRSPNAMEPVFNVRHDTVVKGLSPGFVRFIFMPGLKPRLGCVQHRLPEGSRDDIGCFS